MPREENGSEILLRIQAVATTNLQCELPLDIDVDSGRFTELLGIDSFQFMVLVTAVEEEFEISFKDDITFEELNGVSGMIFAIGQLLQEKDKDP